MTKNKVLLSSMHPTWHFDAEGKKMGLWVQCPKCEPRGACLVLALWEATTSQLDRSFSDVTCPLPRGTRAECLLTEGYLNLGYLTWK